MSKIVRAINAMICNPQLINEILKNQQEYFFLYKNKYKWSMTKTNEAKYVLFYYPTHFSLEELSSFGSEEFHNGIEYVVYRADEIGTREAIASFAELYRILGERIYGLDDILNDIISDEAPF